MIKIYLQRWDQCSGDGHCYPVLRDCVINNERLETLLKAGFHVLSASVDEEASTENVRQNRV